MRKWTYLVAALLVGGATTTFTGCIDNDEPARIEQLRGAKAEFIKAKAAFEDALTQIQLVKVEREQVALEADKVALDLQKLNLERTGFYRLVERLSSGTSGHLGCFTKRTTASYPEERS